MTNRQRVVVLVMAVLCTGAARGQTPISAAALMEKIRAQRHAADFRAEGRLVRAAGHGPRKTYRFSWKAKGFQGTLKALFVVTDPSPDRLGILIDAPDLGRATIRIARPGDAGAMELATERWGEPLLDTALTCEDLADSHYGWSSHALVGEKPLGSRMCYVVRSQPTPGESSGYSSVTSWIGRDSVLPVYVEKILKRSGATKRFIYSGIHRSKDTWGARQVEIRLDGVAEPTYLVLTSGTGNANLTLDDFDPGVLAGRRGAGKGGWPWAGLR